MLRPSDHHTVQRLTHDETIEKNTKGSTKWAADIKPMQHYQTVVVCTKQYVVESFPTIAFFRLLNNCFFHFNGIFLVIKRKSVILNATEKPCRLYSVSVTLAASVDISKNTGVYSTLMYTDVTLTIFPWYTFKSLA